jgi:hypothetical protein
MSENPIITKPYVWSPIIAIISDIDVLFYKFGQT